MLQASPGVLFVRSFHTCKAAKNSFAMMGLDRTTGCHPVAMLAYMACACIRALRQIGTSMLKTAPNTCPRLYFNLIRHAKYYGMHTFSVLKNLVATRIRGGNEHQPSRSRAGEEIRCLKVDNNA